MSQAATRPVMAPASNLDLRYVLWIIATALAYIASAKVGFTLAFSTAQVTAVWPPTGIAVAAFVLLGYRVWPGVWLGAFVSNAITSEPLLTAAGIAVGNTLGPLAGVYLLRRLGFDPSLDRLRDVVGLIAFGSALAMTITATNGVANLALASIVPWHNYQNLWELWWVGDAMGVLLVAPVLLTWAQPARIGQWKPHRIVEIAVISAGTLAAAYFLFLSHAGLAISLYPLVIWCALRFRQRATTLLVAVISVIAIWGTEHQLGPFTTGSPDFRLVQLVTFMGLLAITGLVIGAATAERRATFERLRVAEQRFQVLAEIVPQIVWTADATGSVDWRNSRWFDYTGQTANDAAGWGWGNAHHPDETARVSAAWRQSVATGQALEIETRIRRRDGAYRWFLMRAVPARHHGGGVTRWYGTNTDIDDQKRQLQQTARVAEELQTAFLPGQLPQRPGLRFDALYLASQREALIGGDWYDAFELPNGSIVVSIGDVVGHGVTAAITAGRIRQGIFTTAIDLPDPAAILVKVNRMLQFQESTIASALVAIIDPDLSTMRYASAGHPPPIVASPRTEVNSLPYGGPLLGIEGSIALQNHLAVLGRDTVVLFYTDGVTEFQRDIASAERMLFAAVEGLVGNSTEHPAVLVQQAVMGDEKPSDDAVLLVAQLGEVPFVVPASDGELRKTWAFHSSDAQAAQSLRHELMEFMRGFITSEEELFRVELILGEILANTVEHAPGLVKVEIDRAGDHPTVTIVDNGPGLARFMPMLPASDLMENGRGLYLIGRLSGGVRVEAVPNEGTRMTVILSASRQV